MKITPLLFCLAATAASAAAVEPTTPLISAGPLVVTARDFEAQMLRIPDNLRHEARSTLERVATMTDTLFVNRVLAEEAKKQGLVDDPLIAARTVQIVEAYHARVLLDHVEKGVSVANAEARAREIYLADRARYKRPELYDAEHVLVNLWGRTPQMALERVREAKARLEAGAALADVIKEYGSDTNARSRPTGKLGQVAARELDAEIGAVLPKLALGKWSEPILTRSGYHIVRVLAKQPGRDMTFEEVKDAIVEAERAKAVKKITEEKIQSVRTTAGTRVDSEAMAALVQPISREELEALHRKAAEAQAQGRKPE